MRKHGSTIKRKSVLKNFKRRSVMGTKGYMAPEMAKLMSQVRLGRSRRRLSEPTAGRLPLNRFAKGNNPRANA